jgi:hypothetical protein
MPGQWMPQTHRVTRARRMMTQKMAQSLMEAVSRRNFLQWTDEKKLEQAIIERRTVYVDKHLFLHRLCPRFSHC